MATRETVERGSAMTLLNDFIALTKPRVMSLLLVSAVAGAFLGAGSTPTLEVLIAVLVGGALASGGAASLNMAYESELDQRMGRTKNRPVAEGRISPLTAVLFGLVLNVGAFLILALMTNVLAAVLALVGTVLYFGLYTVVLKRTTTQNIVLGGAAGAVPPLVGYAAASGMLDLAAWYLFIIIFFWTPPHFWALAIMIKDDYAKADIPMLPVVKGVEHTSVQIMLYTLILSALTILFGVVSDALSWTYMIGAALLCLAFFWYAYKLIKAPDRPAATSLYKYSLLFLALFFVLVMVDSVLA
ncbi:heme o synthase [Candidatus Lucifugimonas marina]|jgi:protoheme IX farnesyltransferase|uniref:Protoheme IX farnesyltransferase n=1 Tax=Candidatus Lucifugimonas marina TaxID=3038979 RepID=A0AAJ5ZBT4_9CHLR|nr:protoheme IX farnesyltransferase [SAR202 cluster bacterium JH702]MDG0869817.1 protoheme IX farnesyltransferase [SAR202 cluster bacterium JH639]WFG34544.1 protoheme IX farnesyltransferase [SAR202 cluster bacterium JH545]WFG38472.1 protoheme IX farnesyltransferase [SAR202 cluster bacterium JH1073]